MIVRHKGVCDYRQTWQAMRDFVDAAGADSEEEIWLLEHPPVYTLGRAADRRHLLRDNGIDVLQCDRGGQVTYHGPGQIVAYVLLNVGVRRLGLRALVRRLEQATVRLLAGHGIAGKGDLRAPGVYVDGGKIAALGLRVRRGWTYHGISVNVNMDLRPFADINPCGYRGLRVLQMADFGVSESAAEMAPAFADCLIAALNE